MLAEPPAVVVLAPEYIVDDAQAYGCGGNMDIVGPPPAADAVIVDPFSPKLMPLALLNTTLPRSPDVVPAEKFTGDGAAAGAEAVMTEPFNPNETPPTALLKVMALRLFEVVPADTLMLVRPALMLAEMIEPALVPNVTPLAFENASVEKAKDPLEADAATGCTL